MHRRWGWMLGVVVVAETVVACGGSGYEYVENDDAGLYLRVPDAWTVIEVDTDDGTLGRPGVPLDWIRVVDSSATPGAANYRSPVPAEPVGIAVVEPIETFSERDSLSLETLRTFALAGYVAEPSDPLILDQEADGPVEVVERYDLSLDGGLRGQRVVFDLEVQDGIFVTIDQSAVVDADTTEIYRLLIKCEARCYADRRSEIDEIVDSWTIEQED